MPSAGAPPRLGRGLCPPTPRPLGLRGGRREKAPALAPAAAGEVGDEEEVAALEARPPGALLRPVMRPAAPQSRGRGAAGRGEAVLQQHPPGMARLGPASPESPGAAGGVVPRRGPRGTQAPLALTRHRCPLGRASARLGELCRLLSTAARAPSATSVGIHQPCSRATPFPPTLTRASAGGDHGLEREPGPRRGCCSDPGHPRSPRPKDGPSHPHPETSTPELQSSSSQPGAASPPSHHPRRRRRTRRWHPPPSSLLKPPAFLPSELLLQQIPPPPEPPLQRAEPGQQARTQLPAALG